MKILVCGGREFADEIWMAEVLSKYDDDTVLIHGDARGADRLADKYARWRGWRVWPFPADWKRYGRKAGHLRNAQMLAEGRPDLVIAFPGGAGTADMVEQATMAGVKVVMPEKKRGVCGCGYHPGRCLYD